MPAPAELDRLRVVLVATRNPLNIGAAARAMSNFGFHHLRVVKPYEPSFREARSAVGASSVLASARESASVAEAVADCALVVGATAATRRDLQQPLKRLEVGARFIRKQLRSGRPVALLFGSEKRGLSNEDLSHCHWLLRIPTREEHSSMNLAQAVAICLYEIARDSRVSADGAKTQLTTAGELERITKLLHQTLQASGYLKPRSAADSEERVRRLLHRLKLPAADAELWLGMLRQILWKIKNR